MPALARQVARPHNRTIAKFLRNLAPTWRGSPARPSTDALEEITKAEEMAIAKVKFVVTAFPMLAWCEPASACRLFSIWHYPWKQHCPLTASKSIHTAEVFPLPPDRDDDIPLPDLTPVVGGQVDDATRARLLLRAVLDEKSK